MLTDKTIRTVKRIVRNAKAIYISTGVFTYPVEAKISKQSILNMIAEIEKIKDDYSSMGLSDEILIHDGKEKNSYSIWL